MGLRIYFCFLCVFAVVARPLQRDMSYGLFREASRPVRDGPLRRNGVLLKEKHARKESDNAKGHLQRSLLDAAPKDCGRVQAASLVDLSQCGLTGSLDSVLAQLLSNASAVRSLQLGSNRFSGPVPASIASFPKLVDLDLSNNTLSGSLDSVLVGLQKNGSLLQTLKLSGNSFTGGVALTAPLSFPSLVSIDLSNNQLSGSLTNLLTSLQGSASKVENILLGANSFTGPIASSMMSFPSLMSIDVSSNRLSGTLTNLLASLQGADSMVEIINLANNTFTGPIASSTLRFPSLLTLDLSSNQLSGTLTNLLASLQGADSMVEIISLANNTFTGPIASSTLSFPSLLTLDLSSNQLSGTLTNLFESLQESASLQELFLNSNTFSGDVPASIRWLRQLGSLYLSVNELESVPASLGDLAGLSELDLSSNRLSSVPQEIGQLFQLTFLDLSRNLLKSVPATLGDLSGLQYLYLSQNLLTALPSSLGQLKLLKSLRAFSNLLTSVPAQLGHLSNLTYLDLSINELQGRLPSELGQLTQLETCFLGSNFITEPPNVFQLPLLQVLDLSDNQLTYLPPQTGSLTRLWSLDVSNNPLKALPAELFQCTALQDLRAQNANLVGSIPAQIGQLVKLTTLLLSNCSLSGPLPATMNQLRKLVLLDLSKNRLQGTVALTGCVSLASLILTSNSFVNVTSLPQLSVLLDLSFNQISGPLPLAITKQTSLVTLKIAGNNFQGAIPSAVKMLSAAREIRMGLCNFSGVVPSELAQLPSLLTLDISYNPLEGAFPDLPAQSPMQMLLAAGCKLTSVGQLSNELVQIDLSGNQITQLPLSWTALPRLKALNMANNRLTSWACYGVFDKDWVLHEGDAAQGLWEANEPLGSPLNLPRLTSIDLSGNQLGTVRVGAREVLLSFSYLPSLEQLSCNSCGISGDVVTFAWTNYDGFFQEKDAPTKAYQTLTQGFLSLQTLSLANNNITSLPPQPPPLLLALDISKNQLRSGGLSAGWFNPDGSGAMRSLVTTGNPNLRAEVQAPQDLDCAKDGVLMAKAQGFVPATSGGYECTTLCPGVSTSYRTDVVDPEAMCRCQSGWAGSGQNCSLCPADTFAFSAPTDTQQMLKVCLPCPRGSSTAGKSRQTEICSCKCRIGTFLSVGDKCSGSGDVADSNASCASCGELKTSPPGALTQQDCVCDAKRVIGLVQLPDVSATCRCAPEFFLNWQALRCDPCTEGQVCNWRDISNYSRFVEPPDLKAGFWASTAGAARANFSGHSVFKCYDASTCIDGWNCADGRGGKACSLCLPGFWGGPRKNCQRCQTSPLQSALGFAFTSLLIMPIALAFHVLNQFLMGEKKVACRKCRAAMKKETNLGEKCSECSKQGTLFSCKKQGCGYSVCEEHSKVSATRRFQGAVQRVRLIRVVGQGVPQARPSAFEEEAENPFALARGVFFGTVFTATFQMLQFFQLLSVLTKVEPSLPIRSGNLFTATNVATTSIIDIAGVACMAEQQSAGLELGVRWGFPFMAIPFVLITPLLARVVGAILTRVSRCGCVERLGKCLGPLFCREEPIGLRAFLENIAWKCDSMDLHAAWEVIARSCCSYFMNVLVNNGLLLLTCVRSPNNKYTVQSFPHIECPGGSSTDTQEFYRLLAPCLIYSLVFVIFVPLGCNYHIFRTVVAEMAKSNCQSRGRWMNFCGRFRDSHVHWLLVVVVKDLSMNIIVTAWVAVPSSRRMLVFWLTAGYGLWTLSEKPFKQLVNNMIEVWTAFALAYTALLLGFTMEEAATDALVIASFSLAVAGPVLLLTIQGLACHSRTAWLVPRVLQPQTRLWKATQLAQTRDLIPGSEEVLRRMDNMELYQLQCHFAASAGLLNRTGDGQEGWTNLTVNRLRAHLREPAPRASVEPTAVLPGQPSTCLPDPVAATAIGNAAEQQDAKPAAGSRSPTERALLLQDA